MDPTAVVVFVIGAIFTSITAPLILAWRTEKAASRQRISEVEMRRAEKQEDWDRQDAVAKRAEDAAAAQAEQARAAAEDAREAARLLLTSQQQVMARADEVVRVTAVTAAENSAKLDRLDAQGEKIHTLVNSEMTQAKKSELIQTRATLISLRKVFALDADAGREPTDDDKLALDRTIARVKELEEIVAERARADAIASSDSSALADGSAALTTSAQHLDGAAANLDGAADSLTRAAASHKEAQEVLEVATVKMEDKATELADQTAAAAAESPGGDE